MNAPAVAEFTGHWLDWIVAATWQLALLTVIIAAVAALSRRASPRWRYALWLLVLLKVFLPPSLTAIWSVGAWAVAPLWREAQAAGLTPMLASQDLLKPGPAPAAASEPAAVHSAETAAFAESIFPPITFSTALFFVWLCGAAVLLGLALVRYQQLRRVTSRMQLVDEGPLRVEIERIAVEMRESRTPDLYASETTSSPFLFGVLRPAIVAPRELLQGRDAADVRAVLLHEMHHWRRRDPWVGWLQVIAQALFWFHPFVWLANARLRHEREAATDEAVLRSGACRPTDYGETLLRVLSAARGRSLVQGSLAGVFERGGDLQARLEAVMNYQPRQRTFTVGARAALALFALVVLPMAAPADQPESTDSTAVAARDTKRAKKPAASRFNSLGFVSNPAQGEKEVDPGLTEITVTFDRDMSGGMSWTGDGPNFPPIDESREAHWRDKRTCVLPVKLKPGAFYRVGLNSTSFENFQDADGKPAPHSAIYFATRGAKPAVLNMLRTPRIVETEPADGAKGVSPATRDLRITFNVPMGEGFSWTGGGPAFPPIPDGETPRWSRDRRTCIMPVSLEPGRTYVVGVNGTHAVNFQSRWGVPLAPTTFTFTTAGESASADGEAGKKPGPPKIVKMTPENGADDVDPGLKVLRVTFDRPMGDGFSWTGGGPEFPTIPEGQMPKWSRNRRTCTLPVALEPGKSYRLGLNSPSFKNFTSREGVPLEPVVFRFSTRAE
jgi:beta-lactamase regulating signal transducer with metallopeptidase domain